MSLCKVRPANSADSTFLRQLLDRYPFKTAQRRVQRLDQERLNRFFLENMERGIDGANDSFVVERDGEVSAFASLAADGWHSSVYDLKMGKINSWLCIDEADGPRLLDAILRKAGSKSIEHLSVRIDCEDFANLHLLESAGFYLVDVSTKFSCPMPMTSKLPAGETGGWVVRLAADADTDWMCELGSLSHQQTHFMKDPHLDAEKTRELFGAWVRRCADSLAYKIYMLCDPTGSPKGFVIYLQNKTFSEAVGRTPLILDYVILDPLVRGGGRGPGFIAQSLLCESGSGFDYCELRTSFHNHAAIGCYEKLGFRMCAGDFVLHKRL